MSTNPNQTEELSARAEQLAELARSELGQFSPAQRSRGLRAVTARLESRHRPQRSAPALMFALVAFVALVAFGIGRFAVGNRPVASLSYELDGRKPTGTGSVEATRSPRTLRFSEGTEVVVFPGSRAAVRALDDKGAQLSLENGKLSLQVTPKPDASWSVSVGPFLIRVTGTSFTTEWDASAARLHVRLMHGSVVVTGPLATEPMRLQAGQQLMIGLREREVVIRELDPEHESLNDQRSPSPAATASSPPRAADGDLAEGGGQPQTTAQGAAAPLKWSAEVSAGHFDAILDDAKARGIDHVLQTINGDELAALADAARYRQQGALARRALLAQRERFSRTSRARDAAFLLGRLEEASGAPGSAVSWYERYLSEAPTGTYASEALGRRMLLVQAREGKDPARQVAQDYLRRFPAGAYAKAARSLVQSP